MRAAKSANQMTPPYGGSVHHMTYIINMPSIPLLNELLQRAIRVLQLGGLSSLHGLPPVIRQHISPKCTPTLFVAKWQAKR